MKKVISLFFLAFIIISCSETKNQNKSGKIFSKLSSEKSNIHFANNLTETDSLNYFKYTSIYMGGGVSVGDVNNDGLLDVFFTGNQVSNKLYLNKGDLTFEDISEKAKITGDSRWYTGTTMIDINNDGFLDIYCSVAGKDGNKRNQLFINNKDNTFTESAEKYGLADEGNSVQATFFDYDNDGDLDMYLANYPISHPSTPNMIYKHRMVNVKDVESDKLYENQEGYFVDVSEKAGVKNYSFSLGITAADLNNDGWTDLYVSNDYSIPDFMYINNQDGTFKEVIKEATSQTAFYGMGIDIADINNDGYLDIFQADMDSDDNRRQKANMSSMNPKLFHETVLYGFHYQYMHNCLQLNSGYSENGVPIFSNISRLTGTSSTDWSWAPLFADFDNDGFKDLYVTNGTRREVNNKDFFNKVDGEELKEVSLLEKTKLIPSEKIDNFMFKNLGGIEFKKVNNDWGISHEGFSNGVAYADLDNDGDLELIVSNIDEEAVVFENTSSVDRNFLKVKLKGDDKNTFGLGAKVFVYSKDSEQVQELTLTRGFQSSVAPELLFGLNQNSKVDSVKVFWNTEKVQIVKEVSSNQTLVLDFKDAKEVVKETKVHEKIFTANSNFDNTIKHTENIYDDFDTQVLLPHKMSTLGPAVEVADINNDGLEDIFVGGAYGKSGAIYFQTANGFEKQHQKAFKQNELSEDIGALFFDVDNDNDLDLYVVSGGYEFEEDSKRLKDQLYINNGKGEFTDASNSLQEIYSSGSKAYNIDFNKDGKQDVLVLGRQIPGKYPLPASSFLLKNNSDSNTINFENVTTDSAQGLLGLGMATSAVVTDFNNDSWDDIIIVGEWMSIKVFKNNKGIFEEVSEELGLTKDTTGWWWSIQKADFDNDGDIDYMLGNNGLNYKYKASEDATFDIYAKDFDKNFTSDIVLSYYNKGKQYPVRGKQCSSEQIAGIKKKFKNYDEFSKATLIDVYGKKNLEDALHYQVKSFASIYLENKGNQFVIHKLPIEAQFSSIQQIIPEDIDGDGNIDVIIAGNLYNSEVETPRNDGSYGLVLKGLGNGSFKPLTVSESGFYTKGDVKDLKKIKIGKTPHIISVKNNDYLEFIKVNKK
ncbi:VCBS repeat protein [Tenacibaculum skagerrakense]|uniref:VCBS repeat protein n=1 Tax=Tenacibaculum skagerrakense TaxID=186571 RepID=A0A4V2SLQ0_9FLAO|nr:FG-GAP-like repeat-containing protein [Tenacibaculum skagerrakense]TCP24316.1 VCBS repeat protein [Tenacibaculum skagerrakense]